MGFPEGFNPGLPMYALALPLSVLDRISRDAARGVRAIITLGPDGIAQACEAVGARYFLPYAHGFAGLGVDPVSEEGGLTDSVATTQVAAAIAARGGTTIVHPWFPGDAAVFAGHDLTIVHVER
jgi:hypothetical protein